MLICIGIISRRYQYQNKYFIKIFPVKLTVLSFNSESWFPLTALFSAVPLPSI